MPRQATKREVLWGLSCRGLQAYQLVAVRARGWQSCPQPGSTPGPGHLLLKARGWQGKTPSPQRFAHLKKPLQPSQVMALKWKPVALSPQTPQIRGTFLSNSPAGSGSDVLAATVSMSGGAEEGRYLFAAVNSVTKS